VGERRFIFLRPYDSRAHCIALRVYNAGCPFRQFILRPHAGAQGLGIERAWVDRPRFPPFDFAGGREGELE
jgi:hypothetical protein